MKAFAALVRREFIEHRGAFFIAPVVLLAILLVGTLLAFTVGRIDIRLSGQLLTVAPLRVYEVGFISLSLGWLLYLMATLLFYCADGFAADRRNNAMLFWKSMPQSDFKVLLSKFGAALTILPGSVFAIALLSGVLLYGIAYLTMMINGTGTVSALGGIIGAYGQVALSLLVALICGLLWYLPCMAIVGAIATVAGRWAIPIALILPSIISVLEWVVFGGMHPFATQTASYLNYRVIPPLTPYFADWWSSGRAVSFNGVAFISDLLVHMDWLQVVIGAVLGLLALWLASEYRRRINTN